MNRSASAAYYPFQVMPRFLLGRQGEVYYIGGSDILPPPLETQREARILEKLGTPEEKEAKSTLIEHNLRLVVYIAKKFDNTGVSVEDLISIGTIGLIKAVNTFDPEKKNKLATYASRCIENEILMCLRASQKRKGDVSLQEPIGTDGEGNEITLIDVLGTDPEAVHGEVERRVSLQSIRELAEHGLKGREATVIRMRYGLMDGKAYAQQEVAERLGISRSYISRIEKKALERLKEAFETGKMSRKS